MGTLTWSACHTYLNRNIVEFREFCGFLKGNAMKYLNRNIVEFRVRLLQQGLNGDLILIET